MSKGPVGKMLDELQKPNDNTSYHVQLIKFSEANGFEKIAIEGYGLLEELMDDLEKMIDEKEGWDRYDKFHGG